MTDQYSDFHARTGTSTGEEAPPHPHAVSYYNDRCGSIKDPELSLFAMCLEGRRKCWRDSMADEMATQIVNTKMIRVDARTITPLEFAGEGAGQVYFGTGGTHRVDDECRAQTYFNINRLSGSSMGMEWRGEGYGHAVVAQASDRRSMLKCEERVQELLWEAVGGRKSGVVLWRVNGQGGDYWAPTDHAKHIVCDPLGQSLYIGWAVLPVKHRIQAGQSEVPRYWWR